MAHANDLNSMFMVTLTYPFCEACWQVCQGPEHEYYTAEAGMNRMLAIADEWSNDDVQYDHVPLESAELFAFRLQDDGSFRPESVMCFDVATKTFHSADNQPSQSPSSVADDAWDDYCDVIGVGDEDEERIDLIN